MARYENTDFIDKQNNNDDMILYKVTDVQKILGCCPKTAYKIFKSKSFPSKQIGRRYYIEKSKFMKWLDTYENEHFYI